MAYIKKVHISPCPGKINYIRVHIKSTTCISEFKTKNEWICLLDTLQ